MKTTDCQIPTPAVDLVAGAVHHHGVIFAAGFAPAQLVQAQIGDDPVNPGIKRALEAEVADIPVGLEEGLLVNILGIVLRTGQVQGQPQHLVFILAHQGVEGRAGTGLRLADQVHLVGAALHTAPVPGSRRPRRVLPPCPAHCSRRSHAWSGLYPSYRWPGQSGSRLGKTHGTWVMETPIASAAIASPLTEDKACAYRNRRGMMGLVNRQEREGKGSREQPAKE